MTKFIAALAVFALPVLALAQDLNPDAGTEALIAGIFAALREGKVGLAVVVTLMLVVAILRKSVTRISFLQGDVGGTLLNFIAVVLIMVSGPVSAGAGLTFGLVKTAVLTAFATSGGFTFVKRTILTPLILANATLIYDLVGKVPVVGFLLKLIVKVLIGKYITTPIAPERLVPVPAPVIAPVPGSNVATSDERPPGDV